MESIKNKGVHIYYCNAVIKSRDTVEVNGELLSTGMILICSGSSPKIANIRGLAEAGYLTYETVWRKLASPETKVGRIAVIGTVQYLFLKNTKIFESYRNKKSLMNRPYMHLFVTILVSFDS